MARPSESQLAVAVLEVLGEFFDDLSLSGRREIKASEPRSNFFFPVRHNSVSSVSFRPKGLSGPEARAARERPPLRSHSDCFRRDSGALKDSIMIYSLIVFTLSKCCENPTSNLRTCNQQVASNSQPSTANLFKPQGFHRIRLGALRRNPAGNDSDDSE